MALLIGALMPVTGTARDQIIGVAAWPNSITQMVAVLALLGMALRAPSPAPPGMALRAPSPAPSGASTARGCASSGSGRR